MLFRLACGKGKILICVANIFYEGRAASVGVRGFCEGLYFVFSCGASFLDFEKILTSLIWFAAYKQLTVINMGFLKKITFYSQFSGKPYPSAFVWVLIELMKVSIVMTLSYFLLCHR